MNKHLKSILSGILSMVIASSIFIACIGAIESADIVFNVAGGCGIVSWLYILYRSINNHEPTIEGGAHDNRL